MSDKDIREKVKIWCGWYALAFAAFGLSILGTIAFSPWYGFGIGVSLIGMNISSQRFEKYLNRL